ncbi:cell division site-positioning protein MapZ family protein [Streptococcus sp. DD13]|uniref:cell division site-positioning protein MapZ family protein n=1 Tax=Streptococcus sp. DD13 TaxID=1777881 RepID=UPI000792AE75|nr:cell division site-positioning protein MapZ family protein [Streptococcus sp. DD13]KXT77373.1 hypothetical protein STRDD13_01517 [Streptococcus sp. DD13]
MSEKDQSQVTGAGSTDEPILDFEEAKDLTIAQAVRKSEELKAGVTPDDGVLDRYIKQHRKDIEAKKFESQATDTLSKESSDFSFEDEGETKVLPPLTEEVELKIHRHSDAEEVGSDETEEVGEPTQASEPARDPEPAVVEKDLDSLTAFSPETASFNHLEEDEETSTDKKKPVLLWAALALLLLLALSGAFLLWRQHRGSQSTSSTSTTTSTTTSSTSTTASSSQEQQLLEEFNKSYATFFTDSQQTKLKNSEFSKLSSLQAILDKMDKNSEAYKTAKAKLDQLTSAIRATEKINQQFSGNLIVDGKLDTTVQVKSGADLSFSASGLTSVDNLLTSAVNFGKSQESVNNTPAAQTSVEQPTAAALAGTQGTTTQATPASTSTGSTAGDTSGITFYYTGYGLRLPNGVTLQRNLSRVPYDKTVLADRDNAAWKFADGVLDRILATSRQRGYIQGNNYILERVNIIKGNAYYNLFKPDGTYLFSINAKTGYFVGNGSGHADALDY